MNIYIIGLLAGLFTWGMTALGSATVFLFKTVSQKLMDSMLGLAAGIMVAASIFSLILPALDQGNIFEVSFGFMCGAFILLFLDKVIPHLHLYETKSEGPKTNLKRSFLLVFAITLHNIPEGLAVGIAFGAFALSGDTSQYMDAIALAIGIGIQNFPEGAAISLPLYRDGYSRKKSFMFGQASALVEPIGILVGILLVSQVSVILPFALSFAAGAMMFVVIEELIPESQKNKNTDTATISTILGFVVMMFLDVVLG